MKAKTQDESISFKAGKELAKAARKYFEVTGSKTITLYSETVGLKGKDDTAIIPLSRFEEGGIVNEKRKRMGRI